MFTLVCPDGAQFTLTAEEAARLLEPGQAVRRRSERDYIELGDGCILVCPMGDWRPFVGLD